MMYTYSLAAKRAWRSVYFPVLLLLLMLGMIASVFLGKSEEIPLAGVCDQDGSATSSRVVEYLRNNHFLLCKDENDLREGVASGKYNCGLIIPAGFENNLQSGQVEKSVCLISSPATFLLSLYQNHATAAIFSEYAPIISAREMRDTTVSAEEMIQAYREQLDQGLLFSFDMEYTEKIPVTDTSSARARTYAIASAALLIFVMLMYSVSDLLSRDMAVLPARIGIKAALIHGILPHIAVRTGGILLSVSVAACLTCLLGGSAILVPLLFPIFMYTLAIYSVALLCAAVFANTALQRAITFPVLAASFAFCPIYMDAALIFPAAKHLRILLPPYWLFIWADRPAVSLLCLFCLPLSVLALYLRFRRKTPHNPI